MLAGYGAAQSRALDERQGDHWAGAELGPEYCYDYATAAHAESRR